MNRASSKAFSKIGLIITFCLTLNSAEFLNAQVIGGASRSYAMKMTRDDSTKSIEKKSPKGAMLRSLTFPGWGQFYNEQYIKAALVFSLQGFLVGLSIYYNNKALNSTSDLQKDLYKDKRNETFWFMAGATLLSMLDAYIDAHLYDFDTGPDLEMRIGSLNQRANRPMILGISIRAKF